MLFNNIINIDQKYYLDGWRLYIELIETKNNPESIEFYEWDNLYDDEIKNEMFYYIKLDFNGNIDKIITILEKYIIDIINNTNGYSYKNNKLEIEWWVLKDLVKCGYCGNIWDGFAQCNCYMY
jgi:hypothetical protein